MVSCNHLYLLAETGGIGDAYIQLPMLRAFNHILKDRFTILTSEFTKVLYANEGFCDVRVFLSSFITIPDGKRLQYDLSELSVILEDADCFIDTNSVRSNEEGYEDFIKSRTYPTIGFYDFFKIKIYPNRNINAFDLSFYFVNQFSNSLKLEEFAFVTEVGTFVAEFVRKVKVSFPEDIILIGIQDETKQDKMWPSKNFEFVINSLLQKYSNIAILILGKNTSINIANILEKERVIYFEKHFDFPSLNGLMTILDYFIGIDSVFLHLSDLHRIPTIALFGPTSNKEWGLRFTKGAEIISPTGNMHDITVENVLDCFDKLTVY